MRSTLSRELRRAPTASERRLFLIVNPRAGLGGRRFAGIFARLRERGVLFSAAATTAPGDARVLSHLASRDHFRAIVCVGGDGTVNEVVNGFATPDGEIDSRAVLGIIPSGTVQDFARGARIPLARGPAIEHLLAGQVSAVDVGRIRFKDGRVHFFVNVLGAGFDAEVADRAAEVRGAIASIPAHLVGFASALAAYQNKEISLTFEGERGQSMRVRCNMVVVANGPSYAGVMRLAPEAIVDDGLLDLVVIGDIDKLQFLLNLPRAFTGTHLSHDKVAIHRVRSLVLESEDHALVQADGEVIGELPARVDVLPKALQLIR